MARVEHNETFIEIDNRIRIEAGLPFFEAIATPELLSDTATHPEYTFGEPDARGNMIELGKPFAYIDFYAKEKYERGEREYPHAFKVYLLKDEDPSDPNAHREYKWVGSKPPEEELIAKGFTPEVARDIIVKVGVPPTGTHVEDPDHPMHLKRWCKMGEFDTLALAEKFAKIL